MDIILIEHLSNAACELEAAREYLGSIMVDKNPELEAVWDKLVQLQGSVEEVIRAEAASER
jgi:uncharacterized protein with NRDE domain